MKEAIASALLSLREMGETSCNVLRTLRQPYGGAHVTRNKVSRQLPCELIFLELGAQTQSTLQMSIALANIFTATLRDAPQAELPN